MSYHVEMRKAAFVAKDFKDLKPRPHLHTHLELVYMREGRSEVMLDNKKHMIEAGDLFLAFPNQVHFYHDKEPVKGSFLIFSPEILQDFKEIFETKTPAKPIIQSSTLSMDVCEIIKNIMGNLEKVSPMTDVVAKGYLTALLGEVLLNMELVDKSEEQEAMVKILSYCIKNYTKPLSLEFLSKELHLSQDHISRIFRKRMNTSYKDFIDQLRLEHARELLDEGARVTDTAYACGFSSVRTFNRVFLKHMDMSPREYKKCDSMV